MQEKIREEGIVEESSNGTVEIRLSENEHCAECSAKLFCSPREGSSKSLIVENHPELKKGDHVSLSISGKSLLTASLNLYLYPLLILISSIFLGTELFIGSNHPEVFSFLLAIVIIAIYYLGFFQISKKMGKQKSMIFVSKIDE